MQFQMATFSTLAAQAIAPISVVVLAPFIGSFLGVVASRLPEHRSIVFGRSACPHCSHPLAARDLFPIVSWLALRGRCRFCGAAIGAMPLLAEIGALAVAIAAASQTAGWLLPVSCAFGWSLLLLAMIDWEHFWLPDAVTLPLIPAGLGVAYAIRPDLVWHHGAAMVGGGAAAAATALLYRAIRKRDGLGFGDVKLIAALGAWLGIAGLPSAVLFAVVLALAFVLATSLAGRKTALTDRIAFGTFLALGGWIVWIAGPLVPAL